MAESQSRYGIMEELSNKKINQQEALAKLESELRITEKTEEDAIANKDKSVKQRTATYKSDFQHWKKAKELEIGMLEQETVNRLKVLKEEITTEEGTYEQKFTDWKETEEKAIETEKTALKRWLTEKKAAIAVKKEVISEIDKSVKSLKEISKEQVKE